MTVNEFRQSPQGVVAVHDERLPGGRTLPWTVLWTPPQYHANWVSQAMADQAVSAWSVLRADRRRDTPQPLTEDEMVVVKLVADGYTNDAISRTLTLTIPGVRSRLARIYTKLHARDRAHAVSICYRIGLLR